MSTISDHEPVSLGDYARHRGCSTPAVTKAIARGRIREAVVRVNGEPKITDVAMADAEWAANTNYSKRPDLEHRTRHTRRVAPETCGAPAGTGVTSNPVTPVPLEHITVEELDGSVVLAVCPEEQEPIDPARDVCIPMTIATAIVIGEWLHKAALNYQRELEHEP